MNGKSRPHERGICMKKRFFLAALFLALTLLACSAVALADDDVPPPEMISENLSFSCVEWYRNVMTLDDDLKLNRTTTSISKVDSTHVYVRGITEANKVCWAIGGYMTIQQWKNNSWNKYTTASYKASNKSEATGTGTLSVDTGYYYRLVLNHYANHTDGNAYLTVTTKSVLVN